MDDIDPFEVLGVTPDDSYDTVKKKRSKLLKKYHPDVNKSPDATEQTKRINLAWEIYDNGIIRAKYEEKYRKNSNRANSRGDDIRYNKQRPPYRQQTSNRQQRKQSEKGQERSEEPWYKDHPDPEKEWHNMREKLDREWREWRESYEKWANGDPGIHWRWYQSEGLGREHRFYQRYSDLVNDWDAIQRNKRDTPHDKTKGNTYTSRESTNQNESTKQRSTKHSGNSNFGYKRGSSKGSDPKASYSESTRQSSTAQSGATAHTKYTSSSENFATGECNSTSTGHTPEQNDHCNDSPKWLYYLILILLILLAIYLLFL